MLAAFRLASGERKEGESIAWRFVPVKDLSLLATLDMKTWALLQWFNSMGKR